MSLLPITRDEVLDELQQELQMRAFVYGKRVDQGKMTREKMQHKMDCLRVAMRRLQEGPDFQEFP